MLRIIFKDVPGEKMITHKEYRITDLEGALIQDGDWDSKVVPGARIAMSILMRAKTAVHRCPRCGRSSAGANPAEGGLRWYVYLRYSDEGYRRFGVLVRANDMLIYSTGPKAIPIV